MIGRWEEEEIHGVKPPKKWLSGVYGDTSRSPSGSPV